MERVDLGLWNYLLLFCSSEQEYFRGVVALVPHVHWREYLLYDPKARRKLVDRFTVMTVDAFGNRQWQYRGKLHREGDMPAVVYAHGTQAWWHKGKRHRDGDLPAVVDRHGDQEYWFMGVLHREDGKPAVAYKYYQAWYYKGKRHRDGDLPAIRYANGYREWWCNGKLIHEGNI
jgi:hypothetical protein